MFCFKRLSEVLITLLEQKISFHRLLVDPKSAPSSVLGTTPPVDRRTYPKVMFPDALSMVKVSSRQLPLLWLGWRTVI